MEELVERLENLILHTLNKDDIPVLTSMKTCLLYKKNLTEKQLKFLDVIESRSKLEIKYVDIDEESKELIESLQKKILVGTSIFYWDARPGTYKRCLRIFRTFESERKISEADYSYIQNVFKKWVLDWKDASKAVGQLRYINKQPMLIIGNRSADHHGEIMVEVLIGDQKQFVQFKKLKKR